MRSTRANAAWPNWAAEKFDRVFIALHGRFEGGALRLVEFPAVIEIHHARVVLLQGEVRHVTVELLAAHVFVGVEQAGRAAQQVGIRLEARCDVFLGIARQIVE